MNTHTHTQLGAAKILPALHSMACMHILCVTNNSTGTSNLLTDNRNAVNTKCISQLISQDYLSRFSIATIPQVHSIQLLKVACICACTCNVQQDITVSSATRNTEYSHLIHSCVSCCAPRLNWWQVFNMLSVLLCSSSSSSFNLRNRHNNKVTVYKSNISRSLRHRKAVHSTNTWPVVHTVKTQQG